ncbi:serine hydrolase domain-containing protein [Parendozoicomonas haliclonae]|uniref:6-aminohexanoate-dimer hydrolase n=1 Tax=Parendozoicomonas haliclonae TaxID=1960125 RepID=A0A1X7AI28_9GAMM|nr:serine hydrolase [Parendozoicomonas haliclonae]SMA42681.1 6-aminohexanoate-dimer hydrolase [Parendozoicomonas haliclonae]
MKKKLLGITAAVSVAGGALTLNYWDSIQRMYFVGTLFTGEEQYQNFARVKELFPVSTMEAPEQPKTFPTGKKLSLPESFQYDNQTIDTAQFLEESDTGALLILQDGKIRYEDYSLSGGKNVQWLSMSVAKSVTSLALGIAIDEGHIKSIEQPVTEYLPLLKGSAYDGVRIKDILQMSSGAAWNEDYSNPDSEVLKMGRLMAAGGSLDEFIAEMKPDREPGTFNQYNSADTQVLGALLAKTTGQSLNDYAAKNIWQPLGMEHPGYWIIDDHGRAMAFGGLNATARDYAKIGELYRHNGNWNGQQIVSSQWVTDSTRADAPHLLPGDNPLSDYSLGYGYQWWLMDGDEGEYSAIGVYNQFIYVNPSRNLTIVKLSANSDYGTDDTEATAKELATIELFRAIGQNLTK